MTEPTGTITITDFMYKYFAEIITFLIFLLGSQGIGYAVIKYVAALIAKRSKTKKLVYVDQAQCANHHDSITNSLDKLHVYVDSVFSEVKLIRADVAEATTRRVLEDGIKHKRDKMFAQAAPFFKGSHNIRNFASMKLSRFVDFILDNYKTMWTDNGNGNAYKLFQQNIYALAQSVKDDGYGLAGKEYTDFFYNGYHTRSVEQYLKDVEAIFADIVNNKSERFIDCSMSFAQKFLSEMVVAYMDWIKQSIDEEFNDKIMKEEV